MPVRLTAAELTASRFAAQTRARFQAALAPMLAAYPHCLDKPWRSLEDVHIYLAVYATRPPSFPYSTVEAVRAAVSAHHLERLWPPSYFTEHEAYCRPLFKTLLKHCLPAVQRQTTGGGGLRRRLHPRGLRRPRAPGAGGGGCGALS